MGGIRSPKFYSGVLAFSQDFGNFCKRAGTCLPLSACQFNFLVLMPACQYASPFSHVVHLCSIPLSLLLLHPVSARPAWAALSTPPSALHGTEGLNVGHHRARPPLSPLCNAMRSTRLRNRRLHFALHGCRAAFPLCNARRCRLCRCNAMHSAPLYSPAAECSATQTKFQDRAQLRPGQPVQGRAGNTQREVR